MLERQPANLARHRRGLASALLMLVSVGALLLGELLAFVPVPPAYAQTEPTPLPLYALPDSRTNTAQTSSTLAFNSLTRLLVTANMLSDTLSVMAPVSGELRAEIPVGDDPRSVAVTPDGVRALVANRGDSTLSVVDLQAEATAQTIPLGGVWAYGVVTDSNERAYVSLQGSGEVVVVDLTTYTVAARIATPPFPTGLALWGDFLYITHLWSGDLSLIYLPQARVVRTVSTGQYSSLSPALDIDITRGIAYLPQTHSHADNPTPTYDSRVLPVVNVVQLAGLDMQPRQRLALNIADRPVNMPFALQIDPFRRWVYVANAGSNDVSVIALEDDNTALANIPVGANPRGLLLNQDNSRLFVHNVIDGTVTIVNTTNFNVLDTVPVETQVSLPVDVLIGAEWFHSAANPQLAADRWISCANCHLDGMSDGQVWTDFNGDTRNTPPLFDLATSAPYNWDGRWDELADVEWKIRGVQAGAGLLADADVNPPLGDPHAGLSLDLDAIALYLDTLRGPVSPVTPGADRVARGRAVFEAQGCASCHVMPNGTDQQRHDVGTGGTFDTPTLNGLWQSAPYLHDGSAGTLQDLFALPGAHQLQMTLPPEDIDALAAYLFTLPTAES